MNEGEPQKDSHRKTEREKTEKENRSKSIHVLGERMSIIFVCTILCVSHQSCIAEEETDFMFYVHLGGPWIH